MSVWVLGVCQSRNWEAFSVDLRGQGLPKVPLQNNSGPSSWQRDTGGCCSARTALKPHRVPPTSPPTPMWTSHPQNLQKRGVGAHTRIRCDFTDMIILECGKAEVYVNRHVCDVRYNSGQTVRLCQERCHDNRRTGIHLFTLWHVTCAVHAVRMWVIFIHGWFRVMTFDYVNTGSHREQ